jgi:glycosyltransferase involved in cell wall biosynthesis
MVQLPDIQTRVPDSPPRIYPVKDGVVRPLWSVMIPVYNCSTYLSDTIKSVLIQNIPESLMQIEVVDDASTDADVESIVRLLGKGRVKYYRQPANVGSLRNFETCISRSKGELIHLLHSDDLVEIGYYKKIESLFVQYPGIGAAFCSFSFIDDSGKILSYKETRHDAEGIVEDFLLKISEQNCVQYASITVKREVYEKLGSFYGSTGGEDWEMWIRIAARFPVAYSPEKLARYRQHGDSITALKFLNGQMIKDIRRVIDIAKQYLPEEQKQSVNKRARKYYAWYCLNIAVGVWTQTGNKKNVKAQIKEILKLYHTDVSMHHVIIKLYFKMLINYK